MRQFNYWSILLYVIIITIQVIKNDEIQDHVSTESTDLMPEKDDRLLLFATLSGSLIAIEQQTGSIRWKIDDQPIVQVPVDTSNAIVPIFLPDPRDGSLYLLDTSKEPVKKLPFTIPQLVASSPCRSSDGILYTGKKKDAWFKLDPRNGKKEHILGWDLSSSTCPIETTNCIYIGQTKYTVMMVDSHNSKRKWNVTFYDYSATEMTKEQLNNYDLVHFASSSSGRLVTMDRRRGNILWDGDLGSPVIAAYILDSDGLLIAPFTSLANHTLSSLTIQLSQYEGSLETPPHRMKLYPTLYVGDHVCGLYALPSLVDQNFVTITATDNGLLLLNGPTESSNVPKPKRYPEFPIPGFNYRLPTDADLLQFNYIPNIGNNLLVYIGHYNVPEYSNTKFMLRDNIKNPIQLITDASNNNNNNNNNDQLKKTIGIQIDEENDKINENLFEYFLSIFKNLIKSFYPVNTEFQLMLIIVVGLGFMMFSYFQMQLRQARSQNNSQHSNQHLIIDGQTITTTYSEELTNDGLVRVGKIIFNTNDLLGKGCEGTFVYRGEFDNRQVAVKRLLPECFTFADREVALLRESDTHPNVIRYYCMEQDRMFRYIALELCYATLSDYVENKYELKTLIKPLDILKQATNGLKHLHSLDIVHRDIKPHNVLLSTPNSIGQIKAMISDFGLCKKLQVGRVSFSRRSGITGTDGWIAPEMLNGNERTTCAVDLFSLGCLYYYVLSNGSHPFGDTLRRQANILIGQWNLDNLKGEEWQINIQKPLLAALISSEPEIRPSCKVVLAHPMFWDCSQILTYFQEVSDRVELADTSDHVLTALEDNSLLIVKYDWRVHIHEEVAKDLKKYRSYKGQSVRDLLRALRNKKHHFRELSKEAQEALGDLPNNFTNYWTSRFPLLFIHTYIAMQCVANETSFHHYYDKNYLYSINLFKEQVNNYLINNPIDFELIKEKSLLFDEIIINNDYQQINKSPKKSNNTFYDYKNKRFNWKDGNNLQLKQEGNVGLYRNLSNNNKTSDNTNQNRNLLKRNVKKKSASKTDEPTVWAMKDNK